MPTNYDNPNDLYIEQNYGTSWANRMRARGRLAAPSAAEVAERRHSAAADAFQNRAERYRRTTPDEEAGRMLSDANLEAANRERALSRSAGAVRAQNEDDERRELGRWLEEQSRNGALSVGERRQHQARLDRLHAEDAQLRQDDLARYGIDSRERVARVTNEANIRGAELGLEGTKATAAGGVEQARLRGQADVDAAGVTAAGNLRVERQRGQNAIEAANAAPMTAAPDGTIYDKTDRTGQNIFEKPEKPQPGQTLKPGEVYRDSSGKLTVAPGADEAALNQQIVALYEAAYQPGQDPKAREDALAKIQALRDKLLELRRQPAGQAGAGAAAPAYGYND